MKTSDLIGPALDWAVAKCEGWQDYNDDGMPYTETDSSHMHRRFIAFSPSTNWAQGGPIIEREEISVKRYWTHPVDWVAGGTYGTWIGRGPTPLIAAMRCYVQSKLGNEIDIPKELQ